MRFVWFWTFWHWSRESFRDGLLLRSPLQGIGSHWDEWFRHEASENDRRAIEEVGRTESGQRQFIAWLHRHWMRETDWCGNRVIPKYVLNQLAQLPPFRNWTAFETYRTNQSLRGISAVVLAEGSQGNATDVRQVVAVALPTDHKSDAPNIAAEDFHAEQADLDIALRAAASLLRGKGLLTFLALWVVCGKRPYPKWLKAMLCAGWLAAGGAILYLLFGPDPADRLVGIVTAMTELFAALVLVSLVTVATQAWRAWRVSRLWGRDLDQSTLHLQLTGGLTLRGSSAGLPFCLNILLSLYRARPHVASQSWLWRRCLHTMHREIDTWAATGVVTPSGFLKPVVLDHKLRACLSHTDICHVLVPRQREGNDETVRRMAGESNSSPRHAAKSNPVGAVKLGFAADLALQSHRCRHAAQSLLAIGNFFSRRQVAMNLFAMVVSIAMLAAARDVRSLLLPYSSPEVIPPSSPSPNYLWISLDTEHPRYFDVMLESGFWTNRRAGVARYSGANASVRAEIPLRKFSGQHTGSEKMATVWVERRRYFLWRKFFPGERVGRYSLPYLLTLGYE